MAANDRVEYDIKDVSFGQLAPSQSLRTQFTPGKATSLPGDMNWPLDYKIPVGTPVFEEASVGVGPVDMTRVRIIKLGRNIVSDQTLVSVPVDPGDTTQENDGRKERTSGFDWGQKA
jgi:hypothetical protein